MKDFGKYVLATIVGIFVTFIIGAVLMLMSIVGLVASGEATKTVEDNSVLVLNLNGVVEEQQTSSLLSMISGGQVGQMGLNEILSAIKKQKTTTR